MSSRYTLTQAKNGMLIPQCAKGSALVSLHSAYNPEREAASFAHAVHEEDAPGFFIVLGLAGGYHIKALAERFKNAQILVIERSQDDIDFLRAIPAVTAALAKKNVRAVSLPALSETLLATYKPALHGNLTILPLRQWETLFCDEAAHAKEAITRTIKLLAGDFSVQSHFGKIWQKNILTNLSLAEKTKQFSDIAPSIDTTKTAAIIAAGPSLDQSVSVLKNERERFFIIATDTAFSALLRQGIESDAVVSIDGQAVSHEHYLVPLPQKTLYVFDLCAPSSAVRKALAASKNVILIETGHPLAQYASHYAGSEHFLHLNAGSGTVTIAAADFAKRAGFSHIVFFGADFSYIHGKPYARGTYLERSFYARASRLHSAEHSYAALMYRTPLISLSEDAATTEILSAYKDSLERFMAEVPPKSTLLSARFNFQSFKSFYLKELRSCFSDETAINENAYAFMTLLPLIAHLGKGSAFLAYLKTLRYTESL